ncbi:uncharacterized protein BDW47DRAFT_110425 [Aspergillus candidus]|uniref:Uncharacterized protein n=1 Tax=Aspergillus candidus TaxID=41067 RepID=A0A2I2F4E2_ASPCN|nr:hypothetical protein BDW47DRAFT_110425 [Aspergillus candidus]PLB35493.1 hypothetical protein BDW47DRAFT_110425 [Aspergillus candidus]
MRTRSELTFPHPQRLLTIQTPSFPSIIHLLPLLFFQISIPFCFISHLFPISLFLLLHRVSTGVEIPKVICSFLPFWSSVFFIFLSSSAVGVLS